MAGLARRLAPAAALGGLAVVIVGVADPALAGRSASTATGGSAAGTTSVAAAPRQSTTQPDTSTNSGAGSGTTTQPDTTTQQDTTTQPDTSTQSDTAGTSCDSGQQATGPVIQTRWGPVQVAGMVANGQLCEVHAVVWPDGDGRSAMISQYAIPQLDAQASAQGVQFDGVSGATYTTEGYRASLQGLLDSL